MKEINIKENEMRFEEYTKTNDSFLGVATKDNEIYIYYGTPNLQTICNPLTLFDTEKNYCIYPIKGFLKDSYYRKTKFGSIPVVSVSLMLYNFSKKVSVLKNRAKILAKTESSFNKILYENVCNGYYYRGGEFSKGYVLINTFGILAIKGVILKEYKNQKRKYKLCSVITSDLSQRYVQCWDVEDFSKFKDYNEEMFDSLIQYALNIINYSENKVELDISKIVNFFERNINPKTGYNIRGFDKKSINAITNSKFDLNGFNRAGTNFFTNTKYSLQGFNYNGLKEKDKSKIGYNGYTIDGFDIFGINNTQS